MHRLDQASEFILRRFISRLFGAVAILWRAFDFAPLATTQKSSWEYSPIIEHDKNKLQQDAGTARTVYDDYGFSFLLSQNGRMLHFHLYPHGVALHRRKTEDGMKLGKWRGMTEQVLGEHRHTFMQVPFPSFTGQGL